MERGYRAAGNVRLPVLLLHGEKDEVIPKEPVQEVIAALPGSTRSILYPNGYHMLLRDLQAEIVWHDIAGFVTGPPPPAGWQLLRLTSH